MTGLDERIGICQWFHFEDAACVNKTIAYLAELGITRLRMDVSWADYHRPGGTLWYDLVFTRLGAANLELLPCLWHTPPSLSVNGKSNGPPRDIQDFSNFVWEVLHRYGAHFDTIELWNEPNNRLKWDHAYDPTWRIFAEMIARGAGAAKLFKKRVVLGGMSPINGGWLDQLEAVQPGALAEVDAIGIHAFPGQWNEVHGWGGWPGVFTHLQQHVDGREIFVTEVGFSTTTPLLESTQAECIQDAVHETAVPIYVYCAVDLPYDRRELEWEIDGRTEPLEHHLGLVTVDGRRKAAFFELQRLLMFQQEQRLTAAE